MPKFPAANSPEEPALRTLLRLRHTPGVLRWIGVRPARGEPMHILDSVEALAGRGLCGDRASQRRQGRRQVSVLQAEHLPVIAALCGRAAVPAEVLRRNLVVSGLSVLALRATYFQIGPVLLRGVGTCDPCSKMERALGEGGYNAMRGHGGIVAQVVRGGALRLGDLVDFAHSPEPEDGTVAGDEA